MATSNNDRISSQRLLDTLKGLQASRHLGSEPEVDPQTNEKTKHTIKQDYLPNADWNVNDPDADGYVQGRTHWVEISETRATGSVQEVSGGIVGIGSIDKFGVPSKLIYPNGEFIANKLSDIITVEVGAGNTIQFCYAGIDSNGDDIEVDSEDYLDTALTSTYIGLAVMKREYNGESMLMCYVIYPEVKAGDAYEVMIKSESVHKLPTKYINKNELGIPKIDITTDGATVDDKAINTYPKGCRVKYKNPNNHFINDLIIIPITGVYGGLWYCKLRVAIGTYNESNGTYSNTSEQYTDQTDETLYELIKRQLDYTEDKTFKINVYRNGVVSLGDADSPAGDHGAYIGYIEISIEMGKTVTKTTVEHKVVTNEEVHTGIVRPEFYMEGLFNLNIGTI